ncbi:MAG: efflux RND transporter periplasmic adaptor subunit [bacterium]
MTDTRHMKSGAAVCRCRMFVATGALAALVFAGCGGNGNGGGKAGPKAGPVPVRTALVEERSSDVTVKAVGTVEPVQTVAVRSQVGGILAKIGFKEGDDVTVGTVLFEIDPRTFQAELKRAEAAVARDEAQLANAERQARRYEELISKDFVAKSQYEEIMTGVEVLRATVRVDRETAEAARLQLERSSIVAPFTGRTGALLVHAGDLVKANDVPLVQINQIKPILVRFAVPASNLPEIRRRMAVAPLTARVSRPEEPGRAHEGALCFVDNAVDADTGTILLKARFDNEDNVLWPGQFMDVTLVTETEPKALTAPSAAIQTGQDGLYVFMVRKDMSAERRPVTVLRTVDGTVVIGGGLAAGDEIVVDGQVRLVPGSKVEIIKERK